MTKNNAGRFLICILLFIMATVSACTQSPEDVRLWMRDKRAPVKMKEFIQNPRNKLDAKVESLMVLIERSNCTEIPDALGDALKTDELNRIVAGAIVRMEELNKNTEVNYQTRVKDAAYYLLKLELSEENRAALMAMIRTWLTPTVDKDVPENSNNNFFLPIAKAGRVEQQKLFELLGVDSLPIYQTAIELKLNQLESQIKEETARIAEEEAKGVKYKVTLRPSDTTTQTLASTLSSLEDLKLPGSNDMVASIFLSRIEASYPNMLRAYVLPFSSNTSPKLLPMAKKIVTDPDYKNETLNYYKDVMLSTYYRSIQKDAGVQVCEPLIASDRTGYTRWDCLELITIARGRENFAKVMQSVPDNPAAIMTPADHPTLVSQPSMTLWNSFRAYCAHLPGIFSNQVPLEVFRQLLQGNTVNRMMSMACLATLGTDPDVALLDTYKTDPTDIKVYGMQVNTLGQLAHYTSVLLDKRLSAAKAAEAPKADAPKDGGQK